MKIEEPVNDEGVGEVTGLCVVVFVWLTIEYDETESLEVTLIGSSPRLIFSSSAIARFAFLDNSLFVSAFFIEGSRSSSTSSKLVGRHFFDSVGSSDVSLNELSKNKCQKAFVWL